MGVLQRIDIAIDCRDADSLAAFWRDALGYEAYGSVGQYRSIVAPEGSTGPKLIFQQVDGEAPATKNRLHLDLIVGDAMEAEVERLCTLGASRMSEPITEYGTTWTVMQDPEGNEFCLCVT